MGGIIGGITDAIGLTDNKGAKKAQKLAQQNSDYASAIAAESIAFQKEQYADWKAVYGDIQQNLSDYYKSLTPERVTALGLQNVQKEYQMAVTDITATAAQRGIAGSGLETNALFNARLDNAKSRATVRTMAPSQVAQEKAGFLSIGLGQGTQMLSLINNAYGTSVNQRSTAFQSYLGQASGLKAGNMNAMGDVIGAGIGWASGGASNGRAY